MLSFLSSPSEKPSETSTPKPNEPVEAAAKHDRLEGGYPLEIFLNRQAIAEHWLCGRCGMVADNIVETSCGHSFCELCIRSIKKESNDDDDEDYETDDDEDDDEEEEEDDDDEEEAWLECPVCWRKVYEWHPLVRMRTLLGRELVRCIHSECGEELPLSSLRRHQLEHKLWGNNSVASNQPMEAVLKEQQAVMAKRMEALTQQIDELKTQLKEMREMKMGKNKFEEEKNTFRLLEGPQRILHLCHSEWRSSASEVANIQFLDGFKVDTIHVDLLHKYTLDEAASSSDVEGEHFSGIEEREGQSKQRTRHKTLLSSSSWIQNYDVVLYTEYNAQHRYGDDELSVQVGNMLADFVDEGGLVVVGLFTKSAFNCCSSATLARGRFELGLYSPLLPPSGHHCHLQHHRLSFAKKKEEESIARAHDPSHPLLKDVILAELKPVCDGTGSSGSYPMMTVLPMQVAPATGREGEVQCVVSWKNGTPMVTVRTDKKGLVVAINSAQVSSHGSTLLMNALRLSKK